MSYFVINKPIKVSESILSYIHNDEYKAGGTVDFNGDLISFETGYLVSLRAPSLVSEKQFLSMHLIWSFLLAGERAKVLSENLYIGYWKNEGKYHIDFTYHIEDLFEAIEFGNNQNQIAIWDCKNNLEITL